MRYGIRGTGYAVCCTQCEVWLNIFNCGMDVRSSSSSFVIPKKSSQLCTLLLARARARQMASGGFAISISGTTNRSEIMESFVSKICMYCTIDRIIPPVDFWRF